MTEYLTEQEQIQQLKNWLKQYGLAIVIGVVLAFCLTYGWHYWQDYRNKILTQASVIYDEMLVLRTQGDTSGTTIQAQKLIKEYANTPYSQLAAFMLARDAVVKKNYPEALKQLNWVCDHSKDKSICEIARLRIARIFIAEKKPQEALKTLKNITDSNFKGLIDEIRGDAFLAMNDPSSARKAYELALNELPNAETSRPILQMKLDNLAT